MKTLLSFLIIFFSPIYTYAKSGFKVEIKQVFPKNALAYSNVFNVKREMEKAISEQSAPLRGNNCNYMILIKTPSGSETRYIQNIVWVESVNGVKTYHKKQTSPPSSYQSATNWQGYACTVDGSPKGTVKKEDFVYRVSLLGSSSEFETAFVNLANAKAEAQKVFTKKNVINHLVEVVIYKYVGKERIKFDSLSNKKEYLADKAKRQTADSLELVRKEQVSITSHVEAFLRDMSFVQDKKDSLMNDGVIRCRIALEETVKDIPDSIFVVQKLDSIYCSTLTKDVLSGNKNKAIQKLITEMQKRMNGNDTIGSRIILLSYTKQIETILFPQAKNETVVEDAYKKAIPDGVEPYQFEDNGVRYLYYKKKANEGILVNEQTKEYEIGEFEYEIKNHNQIVWRGKKIKKYTRDGKRIKK